jgi:hypothetical protein
MSKDLNKAFSEPNITLAWKWLNSNTEKLYKNYFRDLYKAFALSYAENIKEISKELKTGTYEPSLSIKVLLPKKSGILRPYTLLSVKDQIVYQALMNIIAEKMHPKVKASYLKDSFGHLYAGKNSDFFYKKWTDGYKAFNKEVTKSFNNGYKYTATFDLTACYDTIDHKVIEYFLLEIGFEREFSQFLIKCLVSWTALQPETIYLGHGIPQGPLSSGFLSEVVLKQFDKKSNYTRLDVDYFRYVDDIRLMAKDEIPLRKALIKLDRISKNIGLFPQTNKINIHEITDIDIEIKDLSTPDMDPQELIDQNKVKERIKELSKDNRINDETKFKYILAHAKPNSKLNSKILVILDKYPHLYTSILNYFSHYKVFPKTVSIKILSLLTKSIGLYEELTAYFLRVSFDKIHPTIKPDFINLCDEIWKTETTIESKNLRLMLLVWKLNNKVVKYSELEKIIQKEDWWIIQGLIEYIDIDLYGKPTYSQFINDLLTHTNFEVAIKSSYYAIQQDIDISKRIVDINKSAQIPLRSVQKIGKSIVKSDLITKCLEYILDTNLDNTINWKKVIIEPRYLKSCGNQIFQCKAYKQTDPTALVNSLDVFNDVLVHYLFEHTTTFNQCDIGKIGRVLHAPTGRFATTYPKFYKLCKSVHELRLESDLSHPKVKGTAKTTRRLRFREIKKIKKTLTDGYKEYINSMKHL